MKNLINDCIETKYPYREHRDTWELKFGKIPLKATIMHLCNNAKCININHLVLGTQGANLYDCNIRKQNFKGALGKKWEKTPTTRTRDSQNMILVWEKRRKGIIPNRKPRGKNKLQINKK